MHRIKVALLLSYICIASISAAIITPALPSIQRQFHLSYAALDGLIAIFLLGYVLGQLIYGPCANRIGRVAAMRLGLWVNLLGIVGCIIAVELHSYLALVMGRFVTALGAASGLSCTFMLLNELLPKQQAKQAMSYSIVAFTVGIALAVSVGGVITQYLNWYDVFWLLLAHGVLMLWALRCFPETLTQPEALNWRHLMSKLLMGTKSKSLLCYAIMVGLVSFISYGYSTAAPFYAENYLHLTASEYGYWNSINMLGACASGFLAAYGIKHFGAGKTLGCGLLLLIPCIVSLVLMNASADVGTIWFFSTTMLLYLFSGMIFPCASYYASNALEDKASASSVMSFINMGSATIAVVVMGHLPCSSLAAFTVMLVLFYLLTLALWRYVT